MTTAAARRWLPGFLALGVIWGCSFLLIKVALDDFSILSIGFARQALGAIALVVWSLAFRAPFITRWRVLGHVVVVALLLNAIPGILFAWAETLVSSSLAGILNATTPLMTTLAILLLFRGERLTRGQLTGLVLGFVGVVVLSGGLFDGGGVNVAGILILLAATACYGLGFPYSRKFLSDTGYSSTSLATAQVVIAAVLLSPIGVVEFARTGALESLELAPTLSLTALGVIGTGIAYILNFRNIELAGSAIASTVTYLSPLVAVIAGWLVLGEALHWYVLLGAVIVIYSAALVQQRLRLPWVERTG